MFDFLRELLSTGSPACCQPGDELDTAIEHLIGSTDPRLKLVPRYWDRLAPAVSRALQAAHQCTESLFQSHELTRSAYALDPLVHALYASSDQLQERLAANPDLHGFLATPAGRGSNRIYGLLTATRVEKPRLGIALQDGLLRRDVEQTVLQFSDTRLLAFGADEQASHMALMWSVFDYYAHRALHRLSELRERRETLEARYHLYLGKLRSLEHYHRGIGGLLGEAAGGQGSSREETAQELALIEHQLHDAVADIGSLDDHLERVIEVLDEAPRLIHIDIIDRRIDRTGVVLSGLQSGGDAIEFAEAVFHGEVRRAAIRVSIPVAEIPPAPRPRL